MFRKWLAHLGAEYGYTPAQVVQLIALLCFSLGFLAIPVAYKAWLMQQPLPSLPPLRLVQISDTAFGDQVGYNEDYAYSKVAPAVRRLHTFNPNTAAVAEWQELGAPKWLAERIGKYRAKGGSFTSPDDMGKIYGFPKDLLAELVPYARVTPKPLSESKRIPNSETSREPAEYAYPIVNLNTADSAELEALPQLGPATARNIVRYRALLGGFVRKEQMYELYQQDSARTAIFLPYLKLYPGEGRTPFEINDLARKGKLYHPYIPKASARRIAAYIRQHGNLARAELLLENQLLDSANYARLLPYLAL
jgi:competence protein ComEA